MRVPVHAPGQQWAPKDFKPRQRDDEVFANEFGVAADGTDQTLNLQRALTHAASQGKTLVIPPGTYTCLNVAVPANSRVRGLGGATLKRVSSASSSVVLSLRGSNVEVYDLTLDGNGGTGAANAGVIQAGVQTTGMSGVHVRNCRILNAHVHAVQILNSAGDVHVVGNHMSNIGVSGGGYGVIMNSQTGGAPTAIYDVEVSGNTMSRHSSNTTGYGTMIRGSDDGTTRVMRYVRVIGNHIDHSSGSGGLGIEVWAEHTTIANNTIRGAGGGFGISYGVRHHGSITGNTVINKNVGIEAIAAAGSKYVACTGNVVQDCPTGIVAWASDSRATVTGNIVVGSTSLPMRISGEYGVASGNLIDCPAALQGINTVQSSQYTAISGNVIAVAGGGVAMDIQNNTAGVSQAFAVTGNVVVSAGIGVRVQGNDATATQAGVITGNDLTAAATKISLSGVSVKGNIQQWANRGVLPSIAGDVAAMLIAQGVAQT